MKLTVSEVALGLLVCIAAAAQATQAAAAATVAAPANNAGKLCKLAILGNEMLQYDKKFLAISSDCATVELTLSYPGHMPVQAMGHNWVLAKTTDAQAMVNAGIAAGAANNYVPAADARILAATQLIGGGQSTSITFRTKGLVKGGDYTYFCSFPGHFGTMKGKFIVR